MNKFDLLIVEDDKEQIKQYLQIIDIANQDNEEQSITPKIVSKRSEALEELLSNSFDAAIIDLDLGKDDKDGGVEVLKFLRDSVRIPVVVYSGYTGKVDEEKEKTNGLYKIYNRGEKGMNEIIKELGNIFSTNLTRVFKRDGELEKKLTGVFHEQIGDKFDFWVKNPDNTGFLTKKACRLVLNHLESAFIFDDSGKPEVFDPSDVYIIPSPHKISLTGDIVEYNSGRYVVLTPMCTLVRKKSSRTLLAQLLDVKELAVERLEIDPSEMSNPGSIKKIKKGLCENHRFYFLPDYKERSFKGGFVDFEHLVAPESNKVSNIGILATVTGDFLGGLVAKFNAYYARHGQPDLKFDDIIKLMLEN
jgi:CheY-like chemotaxis protein